MIKVLLVEIQQSLNPTLQLKTDECHCSYLMYSLFYQQHSLLIRKEQYHDFICHHIERKNTGLQSASPGEMWMFPLIQDNDDITWLYSWLLVSLSVEHDLLSIFHSCGGYMTRWVRYNIWLPGQPSNSHV